MFTACVCCHQVVRNDFKSVKSLVKIAELLLTAAFIILLHCNWTLPPYIHIFASSQCTLEWLFMRWLYQEAPPPPRPRPPPLPFCCCLSSVCPLTLYTRNRKYSFCLPAVHTNSALWATGVTLLACLSVLLTTHSVCVHRLYVCAHSPICTYTLWSLCTLLTGTFVLVWLYGGGGRNTSCLYGHLNQDSSRQMDGPVDTNPLYEVVELACVCALLPCHSWLTDWPT